MQQYLEKALREAKERTRWTDVKADYEAAVKDFVAAALDPGRSAQFLSDVRSLIDLTGTASTANALAQLLFKLTAPGVPDIYQGTEEWDFSLVDPDNRRPVDYEARATALAESEGRFLDLRQPTAKLQVIRSVLSLRRDDPELFAHGDYRALDVQGPARQSVVAYARTHEGRALLVCALRYGRATPENLDSSELALDDQLARLDWIDVLHPRRLPAQTPLPLTTALGTRPIALLYTRPSVT
jgi:(1->4)-alpha-D-glucan 1-alpha-D-glucosylmutase